VNTKAEAGGNLEMKIVKAIALLLVIVGGLNWLLVGLFGVDLVAEITGNDFGQTSAISSVVYVLVGIGALALVPTLARWLTPRATAA
jgi:uncharacterized membrane protein YuzA (DUF378 family)